MIIYDLTIYNIPFFLVEREFYPKAAFSLFPFPSISKSVLLSGQRFALSISAQKYLLLL